MNGKIYVGGAVHFKRRWSEHKFDLKNNKHDNSYLQNSWNKHSEENFEFEIIEVVEDVKSLNDREQYYLDLTQCCKRELGYNINSTAGSSLGHKHTKESKKKMSDSIKKLYENGFVNPNKGKTYSEEAKKKMSDTMKKQYENGYLHPMLGKTFSEKTKKKIADAHKKLYENGYINPMSNKTHSEETKLKISQTMSGKHIGENSSKAKLNEKQVRIIKWLLKNSDMSQREIGKIFGVNRTTIGRIKREKIWKHI